MADKKNVKTLLESDLADAYADKATEDYRKYVESVFVKNGVYKGSFSMDNTGDDSVCLEIKNSKWTVFYRERGKRKDYGSFKNLKDALNEMADILIESKIRRYFVHRAINTYKENPSQIAYTLTSSAIKAPKAAIF